MEHTPFERAPGVGNVREASSNAQQEALENRYRQALQNATNNKSVEKLKTFEETIKTKAAPVITVCLDILKHFVNEKESIYNFYRLNTPQMPNPDSQQKSETQNDRKDKKKPSIAEILFNTKKGKLRQAALSINDQGIKQKENKGKDCFIMLDSDSIQASSTVLENDIETFVAKNNLIADHRYPEEIEREAMPKGTVSTWNEKHKLAVAKLAPQIKVDTKESLFSRILLHGKLTGKDMDYMEVHIYGRFSNKAIKSVKVHNKLNEEYTKAEFRVIRETLNQRGVIWL